MQDPSTLFLSSPPSTPKQEYGLTLMTTIATPEATLSFPSPPLTPQPCRFSGNGNDPSISNSSVNGASSHQPYCTSVSSFSASTSKCSTQAILEMDRERRARREKAKRAKSFLWIDADDDCASLWKNHLAEKHDTEQYQDSLGSPEGISSQKQDLIVSRGPFSHKRRRLSLPTGHHKSHNRSGRKCLDFAVPSESSYEFCNDDTFSSRTSFAECEYYYQYDDSTETSSRRKERTVMMPSLTDDHDANNNLEVPVLSNNSRSHSSSPFEQQLMMCGDSKNNNNKRKSLTDNQSNNLIRTSPLHFYHKNRHSLNSPNDSTTSGSTIRTSHCSSMDQYVCHLRPRSNLDLEEEFTRQLSLRIHH